MAQSNQSYRQARHYLRWMEIQMYEKGVHKSQREQTKMHQALVTKRKIQLGPSIGAPTLKNPIDDLVQGKMKSISEEAAVELQVGRSFAIKKLILNNRGMGPTLHSILGSNLAIQLSTYHQISISRNDLPYLLHPSPPLSGLSLHQLHAVIELNLSSNDLLELPPDLGNSLSALTTLKLDYNKLTFLPSSLSKLSRSLKHLSVAQNCLKILPEYLGDLIHLTHLNLSVNHLQELCPTFHGLVSLTYLDLSRNELEHLAILQSPRHILWHRRSCPLDWIPVRCQQPGR